RRRENTPEDIMRRMLSILGFSGLMLAASPGGTHPHVFVTGGAHFGVNADGELDRLHISWIYDVYASLYLLSYVNADKDGDGKFTADEKERVLADQTAWPDDFAGDSYLYLSGERQQIGKPVNSDTRILEDGRVEVMFERMLAKPFRPGTDEDPAAVVKLYDPTFYYAYEVTAAPEVRGPEGHGCTAEHKPYDPEAPGLAALKTELAALGRDETPDQQDVGALFADDLILSCD
ncbi:MAG: DUF1007 family protein, partial [Paracoccaceae bacterium]